MREFVRAAGWVSARAERPAKTYPGSKDYRAKYAAH